MEGRALRPARLVAGSVVLIAALSLGIGASQARPAKTNDTITLRLLANFVGQPGYQVLIANFERVYPNIKIDATYAASNATLYQLETTQLAAGNGPDLFVTYPGCGTPVSVCAVAKAGHLAPMVKKPWTKRSLPLVTSLDKYAGGLFAFTPIISLYGVFTNDDRFKELGIKVPQTFSQLLDVCRKAKTAGTAALVLPGTSATDISYLLTALAVPTVYAKDKRFLAKQRAGTATFAGAPGWRQALQEFIDMNTAGCFQPGAAGTSAAAAGALFAQGQGLMFPAITNMKGVIDAGNPKFAYSHHLFPGGTDPNETRTFVHLSLSPGVNVHAGPEAQAAAHKFIDFFARPKQNALFAEIQGGSTQYQFKKKQLPGFMSSELSAVEQGKYVISPVETWWNSNVLLQLQQNQIGLITGQRSIDDVLNAMDAAWKQGPT
jgi:raffinose/stachyose/melibiose transport system substrate-binding protein